MTGSAPTCPFLGRRQELARLTKAIRNRQSLLIFGPPDCGKTALVDRALAMLPPEIARLCLRLHAEAPLPKLLRRHVEQLFAAGDPVVRAAYAAQAPNGRSIETWASSQTAGRLRSLLFRAFDQGSYRLFWDDVRRLGLAHVRFLREVIWMRKTPVYLLARSPSYEDLGQATRLFWAQDQRLELPPLAPDEAEQLFDAAIANQRLEQLDLSEFRKQVIEASRNLPGAIVKMVAMAGQPQYRYGNSVKANLIYMDYLMQLASRVQV